MWSLRFCRSAAMRSISSLIEVPLAGTLIGYHTDDLRMAICSARGPASGPETPACTSVAGKYPHASVKRRRMVMMVSWFEPVREADGELRDEVTAAKRASIMVFNAVGEG